MRYFSSFGSLLVLVLAAALLTVACGGPTSELQAPPAATAVPPAAATSAPGLPTETRSPAAAETPAPTIVPTVAPTIVSSATTTAMPASATEAPPALPTAEPVATDGATVFTLGHGTVARYKVEEVLANTGFKVATGETLDVAGSIAFDADGHVVADASRIAVQAATLRTDSNRRDGYVRNRTLLTDTWPEVVFVPTLLDGFPTSITDANGSVEFTITGDLTVRDQTREVTWNAMAEFPGDGTATGFASVVFTFEEFGMDKPRVAIVVSVEDEILLELDFVGTITGP